MTRFVESDSALDAEAKSRGTSTYLVDRRLDMLPVLLTADLCSLRANVERLAFSACVDVDEEGTILETRYARTVIRSRAALTYAQAQRMIDSQDDSGVGASVRRLCALARVLRRKRVDAGALALASPEVKFKLDREDQPTDVSSYQLYEANKVVEEFMLLANVCVAMQEVAVDALAVDLLTEQERGVANGLMYGSSYLGTALGGAGHHNSEAVVQLLLAGRSTRLTRSTSSRRPSSWTS